MPIFAQNGPVPIRESSGESALMGSWDVEITLRNCTDGKRIGTLQVVNIFSAGGSLMESGSRTAGAIEGPGYGTWRPVGEERYSTVLRYYRFHRDGTVAELQRITRSLQLSADGSRFSGTALLEAFDSHNRLVLSRCATEMAERLKD